MVVYTIKTGISNIWQLSGGCLLILPRWRQLRQQLVIRSIDGLLMERMIVGDFVEQCYTTLVRPIMEYACII
jgi:hypothetical protein